MDTSKNLVNAYSHRDLTVIPQDLTFDFVDNYISAKSKSSGTNHKSKGYKFFNEDYIASVQSKYY